MIKKLKWRRLPKNKKRVLLKNLKLMKVRHIYVCADYLFMVSYQVLPQPTSTIHRLLRPKIALGREIKLDWLTRITDLHLETSKIGTGVFGSCYARVLDGDYVSVKTYKSGEKEELFHEADILSRLHHPNVSWLVGLASESKPCCLISKLYLFCLKPASLHLAINDKSWPAHLNQKFFTKLCVDAGLGIQYLHTSGVIHNDIKADNIVLHGHRQCAKAVVIDFGKAQVMTKIRYRKGLSGKPLDVFLERHSHIAPEVARGTRSPGIESDVFSFGKLLMSAGKKMKCSQIIAEGKSCSNHQWEFRMGLSAAIENLCSISN